VTRPLSAALRQLRDGQVSRIRRGPREGGPADHAARPVAAAHGFLAAKIRALHRALLRRTPSASR
jgi:hypothetical protein